MGILSALINDVEDAVKNVTNQAEQATGVQDAVKSALQPIVDGAWTGQGSQAFQGAVQDEMLSAINDLIDSITGLGSSINSALDIIKEVDALASAPVDAIEGAIDAIG